MCDLASHVVCVDISVEQKRFAERCALEKFSNYSYEVINYADFSPVKSKGINKAFSTAVFIHFSPYDIAVHLEKMADLLPVGGRFWFSFLDGDKVKPAEHGTFLQHLEIHKTRHDPRYLVCPQSGEFIKSLGQMYGWTPVNSKSLGASNTAFVFQRV